MPSPRPVVELRACGQPRRVEAVTDFVREAIQVDGVEIWCYRFPDASGGSAFNRPQSSPGSGRTVEIDAVAGSPSNDDFALVSESVGSPVIRWTDVAECCRPSSDEPDAGGEALDRLLQVCTDQAAALEALSGAECVAVCIVVAPYSALRAVVVATGETVPVRIQEIAAAKLHRVRTGQCLACSRLADGLDPACRLLHDGTCFGAIVRDEMATGELGGAWVVPWAHASTLPAITEDERRDLARAIGATIPWLAERRATWRLWLHQAPVGDDSGDVHLLGRWLPGHDPDDGNRPWVDGHVAT